MLSINFCIILNLGNTTISNIEIKEVVPAISGFAKVTKFLGDKAKKVSFLDKENVDDELLEISDKATIYNENFISTTVANIMNDQEVCSFAFAENIEIVNEKSYSL